MRHAQHESVLSRVLVHGLHSATFAFTATATVALAATTLAFAAAATVALAAAALAGRQRVHDAL